MWVRVEIEVVTVEVVRWCVRVKIVTGECVRW